MKKTLSVLLALAMLLSLGVAAAASGDPSGGPSEAPAAAEPAVLTERVDYPDGVTLAADGQFTAPEGYCVIMSVDGHVVSQRAGSYDGYVVFEVVPLTNSADSSQEFSTQSILTKDGEVLYTADAALNGTYDENGISGADITADSPNMSVVTVTNGTYRIDDSTFHILQTGDHASGGNDFTGDGCAVAVTGDSTVFLKNVDITGDGVTRTALFGGLSTHDSYPTVYVTDCTFNSTGDPEGEDCAVWVLGLHGVVRTCQFCDYYDNYYLNTKIRSFGWADLSVDGTENPTAEDLAELTAAYVDGKGYANADGSIMTLPEFAEAATGLTDEYLAQLAAVESEEDMVALPQTNDTSLYYFAGKNTLIGSELTINDMDAGRTGYSSYSIGANINVYSGCVIAADYGNVEANEYASSAYVNGTVVDARKSIVMCHSNAGGITFVSDADLTAGEVAFIYKGTGSGYTQEALDPNAASGGMMMMGATGSNLYVRDSKITAPVLVLAFDSDDPGGLGTQVIELDDSIAPKDESFDVTSADNWGPASTMWAEGGYQYNEAVQAWFQDCRGETALEGDIFNCHQWTSKNLVLTLDNSELTGVISSGWCEHDVDIIDRTLGKLDEDFVGEDGLRCGNRENLGQVTCHPAETVNNGVILSLVNGAVWNVTETSYVSVLNVDETSAVNGTVTVLDSGIIRIDPAAAAADAVPATDGTENQSNVLSGSAQPATEADYQAYEDYLREFMTNYDGVGDGTFDDGARAMALGELDSVGFGADVNAFPFEMYVTVFGAMDYAAFAAGGASS